MRLEEITRRGFIGALGASMLPDMSMANNKLDIHNEEVQDFVFKWVAKQRKTNINPNAPRPRVIDFNKVDKNVFKETWGSVPSGPVNTYHYKRNWVILEPNAGADSLAHEYTHYFQFAYDAKGDIQRTGWDWDGVGPDQPEMEAQDIQRKFKAQFSN
jgi:hypothetical protein